MIKINNFKKVPAGSPGCKVATFDIEMDVVIDNETEVIHIKELSLLEKNGNQWVNFQQKMKETNGQKVFYSVFELANAEKNKTLLNKIMSQVQNISAQSMQTEQRVPMQGMQSMPNQNQPQQQQQQQQYTQPYAQPQTTKVETLEQPPF